MVAVGCPLPVLFRGISLNLLHQVLCLGMTSGMKVSSLGWLLGFYYSTIRLASFPGFPMRTSGARIKQENARGVSSEDVTIGMFLLTKQPSFMRAPLVLRGKPGNKDTICYVS